MKYHFGWVNGRFVQLVTDDEGQRVLHRISLTVREFLKMRARAMKLLGEPEGNVVTFDYKPPLSPPSIEEAGKPS